MTENSPNYDVKQTSKHASNSIVDIIKSMVYIAFGIVGIVFIVANWKQIGSSLEAVQKFSGFGLAVELRGQLSTLPIANPTAGKSGFFLNKDQLDIIQNRSLWSMPALSKASILWVDDNPVNNNNVIQFLQWARISVRLARSNSEAIQEISDNNFDIIVSDASRENEPNGSTPLKSCPIHFYQGFRTEKLSLDQLEKYNKQVNENPEPGFYLAEIIHETIPRNKRPPILYFTAYDKAVHASCAVITTGDSFEFINAVIDVIEQKNSDEFKRYKLPWSAESASINK